jgi:hypothetical protein
MATDGNSTSLTTKQQKAIAALLSAKDVQSAAQQAGVGERTLHRWMDEDKAFQTALRAAESQAIDAAVRRLTGAANSALNVVMVLMLDQKVSPSVRLRAALSVLEQMVKLREQYNLEQRIAELEARMAVSERTERGSRRW